MGKRRRIGAIFFEPSNRTRRDARPTEVKGYPKKTTFSPHHACVHSLRDGQRVSVLSPRARAGVTGTAAATRVDGRLLNCFLSRHGVPSGLARERTTRSRESV